MSLKLDFNLDNQTFRHYLNGHAVVMHSHHYLALITKLVEDTAKFMEGFAKEKNIKFKLNIDTLPIIEEILIGLHKSLETL